MLQMSHLFFSHTLRKLYVAFSWSDRVWKELPETLAQFVYGLLFIWCSSVAFGQIICKGFLLCKMYLLCSQSKWKHWGGGKNIFFRMRKSVSHWHFPAFPQKVQWNGSLPSISTGVSGEVRRQEMWWTILLNCKNWSCSVVNTNRHTVMSAHIVCACGINMGERRAELSNQAARLSPEPFWLPREKRILFRRSPINGQYAPLPPLTL